MSDTLDKIADRGNRSVDGKRDNKITCRDGFNLSVIAGAGAYSRPRTALRGGQPWEDEEPADYPGPYTAVEVGYPSERPEPYKCSAWNDGYDRHEDHPVCDGWESYGNEDDGIYAYVPVEMVRALIDSHGGEA